MGLSFAQTLGNAAQSYEEARTRKIQEQQTAQELAMRQQQLAQTLQAEMVRNAIAQRQLTVEEGRAASEQARAANAGWIKVGETKNADGTFNYTLMRPKDDGTFESRVMKNIGTPVPVVQQGLKNEGALDVQDSRNKGALDLEGLRNKDRLEQIAAQGRWHARVAEISSQGKLRNEEWQRLNHDPGYLQAKADMQSAVRERLMILAKMYSTTAPPTTEQFAALNTQLQQVEQRLTAASKAAEDVRNRVQFGADLPSRVAGLKQMMGSGGGGGAQQKYKAGDSVIYNGAPHKVLDPPYDAQGQLRLAP